MSPDKSSPVRQILNRLEEMMSQSYERKNTLLPKSKIEHASDVL
jgi:hypothetical protein